MLSLREAKRHLLKTLSCQFALEITNEEDTWLGEKQMRRQIHSVLQIAIFIKDVSYF